MHGPSSPARPCRLPRAGWCGKSRVVELLALWIGRRRQRRALAALDDHLLRDLGLTREDAVRESGKPFWRG